MLANLLTTPTHQVNWASPLNAGLVAWWLGLPGRMGGGTWLDLCGRANGSLSGGITSSDWGCGGYYPGLLIDAHNENIDIGNPAHLQTTGSMSLQAFIRPLMAFNTIRGVISKHGFSGNRGPQLGYQSASGGLIGFNIASDSTTLVGKSVAPDVTPHSGLPFVITAVYDASAQSMRIYCNQRELLNDSASVPSSQYTAGSNGWKLGQNSAGGTETTFLGWLMSARIWFRALSRAEVAATVDDTFLGHPEALGRVRRPLTLFFEDEGPPSDFNPAWAAAYHRRRRAVA